MRRPYPIDMPQTRADELTYYDALGIASNASPDQVRYAFRSLVRMIHPDHHPDEQLKAVAELQMRKLNRIYGVLSDAERRRAYDFSLEEERGSSTPLLSEKLSSLRSSQVAGIFAWTAAAIVGIVVLTWAITDGPTLGSSGITDKISVPTATVSETGARRPDIATELARTKANLKIALFERDAAMRELDKLRGHLSASSVATPSESRPELRRQDAAPSNAIETMTELPGTLPPVAPIFSPVLTTPSSTRIARVPPKVLTGFWFYLRTPEDKKNPGLYPPEFIEATISELNGQVKGRYRSRYRIVDRAISPDVNFEFTGKVSGNSVAATWTGPGSAHGEITIRRLSDNSMRVEWTATQLGSLQGLTAGTAALTRRLD